LFHLLNEWNLVQICLKINYACEKDYNSGKNVIQNSRRKPTKIKTLPYPSWDLFPMDQYTTCLKVARMKKGDKVFPLLSTRGCINKCLIIAVNL